MSLLQLGCTIPQKTPIVPHLVPFPSAKARPNGTSLLISIKPVLCQMVWKEVPTGNPSDLFWLCKPVHPKSIREETQPSNWLQISRRQPEYGNQPLHRMF